MGGVALTAEDTPSGLLMRAVAGACREWVESTGVRRRARDNTCVDFYAGAIATLTLTGHTMAADVIRRAAVYHVAPRGYHAVVGMAQKEDQS